MVSEAEPNNSFTSADEVSFRQTVTGKLTNSSDEDFFKFYVGEAMKVSFEFTENDTNTDHRWDARILSDNVTYDSQNNSFGRFIVNSEEFMFNEHTGGAGNGFNAYFDTPGWYYIQIRQASSNFHSNEPYSFILKETVGTFYNEYEYNDTLNITARKIRSEQCADIADFATGSNFKPYITRVGLYNEHNELLVVGNLGQPVRISDETDTTFVLRWDV